VGSPRSVAIGRVATVEGPAMADIPDCHCGALLQSALAGVQEASQSSNGVSGQNGTGFAGMSLRRHVSSTLRQGAREAFLLPGSGDARGRAVAHLVAMRCIRVQLIRVRWC